jgi:hypothetical protein
MCASGGLGGMDAFDVSGQLKLSPIDVSGEYGDYSCVIRQWRRRKPLGWNVKSEISNAAM